MMIEDEALPLNLQEYEEAARSTLSPLAYSYIAGGAQDEVTLGANRETFARWRLLPRVLRGISEVESETTVLGQPISLPVLLAPVALHRLAHRDGEIATARAAAQTGTIFTLSTLASYAIEDVAPHAGCWWFQLYVHRDRGITRDLVQRAEAAGASALVVTVDAPVPGRRESYLRHRAPLPEGVTFANFVPRGRREIESRAPQPELVTYAAASVEPALSWHDITWLASLSRLPLALKGILSAEDARLALEHGARALVVSNHGGRQLDSSVATLDALPAVAAAAEGGEVYMDGGIRRGTDVIKALALGARAVLLGRPYVWGLAVAGEAGAQRVIELLRAEIALAMTLCGCARLQEVNPSLIVPVGSIAPDLHALHGPNPEFPEGSRT